MSLCEFINTVLASKLMRHCHCYFVDETQPSIRTGLIIVSPAFVQSGNGKVYCGMEIAPFNERLNSVCFCLNIHVVMF